jgi:amino acid transporter
MIKPNKIFSRERTAWGIPVSTLIGLLLCALLLVVLAVVFKMDMGTATWAILPFAAVSGFFTGGRYQDAAMNLLVHPQYIYIRGDGKHDSPKNSRAGN